MKKDCITHTPQQPKIQTAQGWQQMVIKEKKGNTSSKETELESEEKEKKNSFSSPEKK